MKDKKFLSCITIIVSLLIMIPMLVNAVNQEENKTVNNITTTLEDLNTKFIDLPNGIIDTVANTSNISTSLKEITSEEKEMFAKSPTNFTNSSSTMVISDTENIQIKNDIVSDVMNKFYPSEFKDIREDIQKQIEEQKEIGKVSESKSGLLLCDLIIDILKNKELTREEKIALLDYLQGESSNIRYNLEAKQKIKNVIEEFALK